jgi:UTP-glucose-1-phosphate uridylyltransferase
MVKPTLLILAAGMGSRYGGLKQIDQVGTSGETIIDYSVYDAIRAGFGKVVFVIRKDIEEDFKALFSNRFGDKIKVDYVLQEIDNVPKGISYAPERQKPWGTGHAILVAASKINEPFIAINADDFYGAEAFELIAKYLNSHNETHEFCMVGYYLKNTLSEHGSVSRGVCTLDENQFLKGIVEHTKIQEEAGKIIDTGAENSKELDSKTIVSMNFWGFQPSIFKTLETQFKSFIEENKDQLKAEFYIPSVVDSMIESKQATAKVLANEGQWVGVTYKDDKKDVVNHIKNLVETGKYPNKLW